MEEETSGPGSPHGPVSLGGDSWWGSWNAGPGSSPHRHVPDVSRHKEWSLPLSRSLGDSSDRHGHFRGTVLRVSLNEV